MDPAEVLHNEKPSEPPALEPSKTKAELRAERRAKQEAQRAAKLAKKGGDAAPISEKAKSQKATGSIESSQKGSQAMTNNIDGERFNKKLQKSGGSQKTGTDRLINRVPRSSESGHQLAVPLVSTKVDFFEHLPQYVKPDTLSSKMVLYSGLHPAVQKFGLDCAHRDVLGSNERCIGLMKSLKQLINDYTTPPNQVLRRHLEKQIEPNISFVSLCRPISISMQNAIKYLKWHIGNLPVDPGEISDLEAKERLSTCIDDFLRVNIDLAGQAIQSCAHSKINQKDVILIYGGSALIIEILEGAKKSGTDFEVIVVDSRPAFPCRPFMQRLVDLGIHCSYVLITSVSYIMHEVTKVFLGAGGLLANGFLMSCLGSSQISLIASSFNVPVLVCCETYKFSLRVQTDAFVSNELGNPDALLPQSVPGGVLSNWHDNKNLQLLNLCYDVTPPELVTMVITEFGMIPCTSVPVVLRVKHNWSEAQLFER